jgi:hypothetical protein
MRCRILALLLLADVAVACSCSHLTECDLVKRPVIFIGKVIGGGVESVREDPWYTASRSVRFEVIEAFRGLAKGTKFVNVATPLLPGMCSPNPYRPGRTYLVTPRGVITNFEDGICFTGRDIADVSDQIDYLRRHLKNPRQTLIRGQVAGAPRSDSDLVDFMLGTGEAKPLPDAKVLTITNGKTYSTTTNSQGRFELAVPGPGRYLVHTSLKPYPAQTARIDIPSGSTCTVRDFGLTSHSSISGNLLDDQGQILKHREVGLIDLDRPPTAPASRFTFQTAYTEQPDGSYRFENVPLGRYILASNPDGPHSDGYKPVPLETTFYPNASSPAAAKIIEINNAGMRLVKMDLVVGQSVAFRSVTVKFRYADGSPMRTAAIDITGEPLESGGIPWQPTLHFSKGQTEATFQVPVNRKIRISVRDRYRRELGATYESIHEPGSTPIVQEFTIVP